jgi:hydrogenase-4 component F
LLPLFSPQRSALIARLWAWLNAFLSLVALGAALAFAGRAIAGVEAPTFGAGELLRADGLSALLMICISGAASLTLFLGPGLGEEKRYGLPQLRRYQLFINLFIFAMLLAVAANNVALMWISIEATTIFSAILIPLLPGKGSVEASWKYILIGSVGIALAFAGTVLGYFDFVTLSGRAENALNWPVLLANAPSLHPEVMKLAFVFLLVGYGTKAGIAPMHTWKPDAYGEAPAPLAALMASALFAVAMYAILRWKVVADAAIKDHYADKLLLGLGLLSLSIAAFSIVLARNYRRMLAYSSVEHTGLICLGLGLGPLGAFAALLHLVNHTAAKSLMFILAGNIEQRYVTGNRLLRGAIVPGSVSQDLPEVVYLTGELDAILADFNEVVEICLHNTILADRLEGAGELSKQIAVDHGVLGYVARASGIDKDVRRDHPFAAYGMMKFP